MSDLSVLSEMSYEDKIFYCYETTLYDILTDMIRNIWCSTYPIYVKKYMFNAMEELVDKVYHNAWIHQSSLLHSIHQYQLYYCGKPPKGSQGKEEAIAFDDGAPSDNKRSITEQPMLTFIRAMLRNMKYNEPYTMDLYEDMIRLIEHKLVTKDAEEVIMKEINQHRRNHGR